MIHRNEFQFQAGKERGDGTRPGESAQKNSGMHLCIPEPSLSIYVESLTSSSSSALPLPWLLPSALLSFLLPFYSPLKHLEFAPA
jgi:hypothetical protein